MSNVYIVSRGDYSDYEILSVWTDREKAEEVCELMKPTYGECVVGELPLNTPTLDSTPAVYATYTTDAEFTFNPEKVVFQDTITDVCRMNTSWVSGTSVKAFAETKEVCLDLMQNAMIEEVYKVEKTERLRVERENSQKLSEAPMTDEEFNAQRKEWLASQRFH